MKFSVNWLREFAELPESIDALTDLLTLSGIEIEAIENRGGNFGNVVVVQITESKPHPNADRLTVCTVDDGSEARRQIVCGAKNYKVGDKVLLALPGAELPGGLKIKASKLRGIESEGMLCSAKELRIAEDSAGLLILSPQARIGAPINEVFQPDVILDVEITPNRGDLLSHFGLAREVSALARRPLRVPATNNPPLLQRSGVTISALRGCPFYSALRIESVKVGTSPDWVRAKIESVGIRSINNVVDITNYVMLELGQPLHAFDADKLRGDIKVRLARDGEKLLALDGRNYLLGPDDLVIADVERVIAIAGVMGGEETGVTERTTSVLLESAYFLPSSVRRTARNLNSPSDSSYRFERGVDPRMVLPASARAADLMREISSSIPAKVTAVAGDVPADPAPISLRQEKIDQLLGVYIEPKASDVILQGFGLQMEDKGRTTNREMTWMIPSYRRDLQREVDLIEEIIRAQGIDKVPSADRSRFTPSSEADCAYDLESRLREVLVGLGLSEVRTSSLIPRSQVSKANGAIELRNPLSEDHVALRTSLFPGLLATAARNIRAGAGRIVLFEIGNVFAASAAEQTRMLGILLCGNIAPAADWRAEKKRSYDFFDLKGVIDAVASTDINTGLQFRRRQEPGFALGAEVFLGETRIGFCGQLSNAEEIALDAVAPVLIGEINFPLLLSSAEHSNSYREIDRHPAVTRDIAMFVKSDVSHAQILAAIVSARETLLEKVELFDLFTEKKAETSGQSRKSLAYSLTYRDKNRTLTSEEVSEVHARIRERLRSQVGAELRE